MSKTYALIAALVFCLGGAGCQPGEGFTTARKAPILAGSVMIGLPTGYCIDKRASTETKTSAVIFLGRCSTAAKAQPAVISIAVAGEGSASAMSAGPAEMAKFFGSPQGRAALSRNGRAKDLRIITALGKGDALLLHLGDRQIGEYWRAVVAIRGRLVTISTIGSTAQPLPPQEGRKLLETTLTALRAANNPTN